MFSQWYALALYALAGWTVIISIYIVSERRSPAATIAWVLSLSFLPIIGFAVYFFLGPRRFDRKKRRRVVAQDAIHNISFAEAHPFTATEEFSQAEFLIDMCIGSLGKSAFLRQAEFELILKGARKYVALLEDIANAEKHISMEYYIWANDRIGTRVRDALVVRAEAGVKVRLHLDGVGSGAAGKR
ncbi:MAG: PLDc N-terminal domain-containing protein, partial [Kofleriaceae bacterium]|nr:PLDc N-terminal domain-containing protein [Kofleriaceae bacterium]